jgi:hypothetical protein
MEKETGLPGCAMGGEFQTIDDYHIVAQAPQEPATLKPPPV